MKPLQFVKGYTKGANMISMLTGIAILTGIQPALLIGICLSETSLDGKTLRNVYGDNGKSYGICQVQCDTARMFNPKIKCDNLNNPTINAHYAAEYLNWQTYRYRKHKNKEYCIKSAYNAGTCIRGNQKYVDKVRKYQKRYSKEK